MVWISLLLAIFLAILAPFIFVDLMTQSLAKLHLSPSAAMLLTISIFVGGLVNIPIRRISAPEELPFHPLDIFGLGGLSPEWRAYRRETVIAVNVGGCLIPSAIAAYQLLYLAVSDLRLVMLVCAGAALNIGLCYALARPVARVGIIMPGFASPLAAASLAILLTPTQAAPAAFIIGVAGPLIGADLLHLAAIRRIGAGVISIGGAGTFDGIVLSAVVAAYLA